MQRGFAAIPNHVIRDATIPASARLLYGIILSYAFAGRRCTASTTRLCEEAGIGRSAFFEAMKVLTKRDLLTVVKVKTAHGWRNAYTPTVKPFHIDEEGSPESGRPPGGSSAQPDGGSSAQPDTEEDKVEEDNCLESGRACANVKISGKPVNAEHWQRTAGVLDLFNAHADRNLRLLTSAGEPSEAAKRIYGRIRAYPDIALAKHEDIIRRTLASQWWGHGPPSIGVVFGPNVFEENITRPGLPRRNGNGQMSKGEMIARLNAKIGDRQ